jgi:hypothetical protein
VNASDVPTEIPWRLLPRTSKEPTRAAPRSVISWPLRKAKAGSTMAPASEARVPPLMPSPAPLPVMK